MYINPFQISIDTLIGVAPMLGHRLEDRSSIRDEQDPSLVQWLQSHSSANLRDETQQNLFCVAPLDVMVTQDEAGKKFHILEINGTGIGGLTNLTGTAVSAILENLVQFAESCQIPNTLILIASSGKENNASPRLNGLLHEKILYAEALKRGFEYSGRQAQVLTMTQLMQDPSALAKNEPTIVLGYMKEFLTNLECDEAGKLFLMGRQVNAALNDRFCLNILHQFKHQVDLNEFQTLNRGFLVGADKGVAYELLNDFFAREPRSLFPDSIQSVRVHNRQELLDTVIAWVRSGRKAVIKPQGTGLGHGIEFFLDADENEAEIAKRIDDSLAQTEELYHLVGGAFPYTICEFLDGCVIENENDPLVGHKFELRIVVYRDGMKIKAFPSIVKISSITYQADHPARLSLINNITASSQATQQAGIEFMQPLSNRETLARLGLSLEELLELCETATHFMRYVLDQIQDAPERLGLPAVMPISR